MSTNAFKIDPGKPKGGIFSRAERLLKLDAMFEKGFPVKYLPHILFVTIIGIFYIGNSHYAESNVRKIDRLKVEVEDLRADYTTLKAGYMFDSKQSEVAKKAAKMGIEESMQPPEKIVIAK